jgi:glycosyltransferase involved in cell wall biosynthesis
MNKVKKTIWLVTIGESTPIDNVSVRLLRAGQVAELLSTLNYNVVWFNSRFDHIKKKMRIQKSSFLKINYQIIFLNALGYKKNVSLKRLIDHYILGLDFLKISKKITPPNFILCSYPSISLCEFVIAYAKKNNIKVAVDYRDDWPEAMENSLYFLPSFIRKNLFLWFHFRKMKILNNSTTIVVNSSEMGDYLSGRYKIDRNKFVEIPFTADKLSIDNKINNKDYIFSILNRLENRPVFIFAGTIGISFDFQTLLDAVAELNNTNSNSLFIIAGDGELLLKLKKQYSFCKNLIFTGLLSNSQLNILFDKSDFGLAPYKNVDHFKHVMTNKPIEYLSYGLAIFTSLKESPIVNIINKYDCGFQYQNVEELVKKIHQIESGWDKNNFKTKKNEIKNIFDNYYSHKKFQTNILSLIDFN